MPKKAQPSRKLPNLNLEPFSINVQLQVLNPTNQDQVTLGVVNGVQRYLRIPEDSFGTITWTIVGNHPVKFDNPPMTFASADVPITTVEVSKDRKTVTLGWENNPMSKGRSFYYTLRALAVFQKTGATVPLSHDPTVHNEPPS